MSAITPIDAPDAAGVPTLAYAVNGEVTGADVDAIRADFDRHDRVRLLLRVDDFEVPDASAFSRELVAMKTGAVGKIERYAIVGGPDWIAGLVGTVGGLMPFPMEHFDAEDPARAWLAAPATGDEREDRAEAAEKAAPAVTRLDSDRPDLVALAVSGHLTADDYERTVDPAVEGALAENDEIDLLMRLDGLDGFSLGAAREDFALAKHLGSFRKMALVGGPDWMTGLVDGLGGLVPVEVETFDDEAAARAWLGGA